MQIQRIPSFQNPLLKNTRKQEDSWQECIPRRKQNPTNFNENRGRIKEQIQLLEE